MIVCFYNDQAELLLQQLSFEIDMGFKRVRDSTINEVVFSGWVEKAQRGIHL